MIEKQSNYGRGLIICLVKFAEHFENESCGLIYSESELTKYINGLHQTREITISQLIETWANGASDHLYEIQTPEIWTYNSTELTILITSKLKELQEKGLAMGHGHKQTIWTRLDLEHLFKLTKEISILLDKQLGIYNSNSGQW